jgi:hypothetical protein
MNVRFQADADLDETILRAFQREEPSAEFQAARAAELEGVADPDVLAVAQREGRLLVTHDARTMPHHFGAFLEKAQRRGETCPGVLIVPQRQGVRSVVNDLLFVWATTEARDWHGRIAFLPL